MYEDKDIERILFGKLIVHPDQYVKHHANLSSDLFVNVTCINIYNSYTKLLSKGIAPDLVN